MISLLMAEIFNSLTFGKRKKEENKLYKFPKFAIWKLKIT